ncbi:MAG: hypothetical protein AB7L13_13075 [Acidimicrobiia bacterium]
MQLEDRGIPTVVVTTTGFLELTNACASAFGLPDARIVVIEHPLGGIEEPAVLARAATIVEDVLRLWVRS